MIQTSLLKKRVILEPRTTPVSSFQTKSSSSKFQELSNGNTTAWASLPELLRWKTTQQLSTLAWKTLSNEVAMFKMQIKLSELYLMWALKQSQMRQILDQLARTRC